MPVCDNYLTFAVTCGRQPLLGVVVLLQGDPGVAARLRMFGVWDITIFAWTTPMMMTRGCNNIPGPPAQLQYASSGFDGVVEATSRPRALKDGAPDRTREAHGRVGVPGATYDPPVGPCVMVHLTIARHLLGSNVCSPRYLGGGG